MSKISPVTGHYVDVDVDGLAVQGLLSGERTGPAAGLPAHRRLPQPSVARAARRRGDHQELSRHRLRPAPARQVRSAGEHASGGRRSTSSPPTTTRTSSWRSSTRWSWRTRSSWAPRSAATSRLQLALRRPDRFAGVIPVEGADYSPGFYLDWWQHPHANAAQVCASGVWDLMAPQSPEADRWKTWFYYTQGSEAFKGDLYFYSVDHDLRDKLWRDRRRPVPGGDADRRLRLPHHPRGQRPHRAADQGRRVHRDEGHRPLPDEREPPGLPDLSHRGAGHAAEQGSSADADELILRSRRAGRSYGGRPGATEGRRRGRRRSVTARRSLVNSARHAIDVRHMAMPPSGESKSCCVAGAT